MVEVPGGPVHWRGNINPEIKKQKPYSGETIMSSLKTAVKNTTVKAKTNNGMKTNDSSLSANVDLFFLIGSSRGKDISAQFERAYQEDKTVALRILAWSRDIRGGAGERSTYRSLLKFIEKNHEKDLPQMISVTPEFGRWDDLLVLDSELGRKLSFDLIKDALLVKKDGLCAKWMPRKGDVAAKLRTHLGLTPKGYRKTLVGLTKVVETAMCQNQWDTIEYGHVPSVAAARYQKAFGRHDATRYAEYRNGLEKGTEKINASAVYPYDVIRSIRNGDDKVAKAQWQALPNYIGDALVLPMCDVSGSMAQKVGGSQTLSCMDVCISIGLYLADKNTGPFKDMFLTFSEKSKIEVLTGDIVSKMNQLSGADWGMSTNLHSAFDAVLDVAKKNHVSAEDMPKYLLILSDMEFNACTKFDDSAFEMAKRKYESAGYELPNIVFWTLNARAGNIPVRYDERGTALVSGFSPAIMTSVLKAEEMTPKSIMEMTINSPRYQVIK